MIPVWVRMTMNVLLVLKTVGAAVTLYRQNERDIRRALHHLRRGSKLTVRRWGRHR